MTLTNTEIKNLKPTDRAYKRSDGGGLHLLVQPSGSKLWRMQYRHCGRQKLLSFGPYPAVSLLEAREKREDAKRVLRAGDDPAAIKSRKAATGADDNSFRLAAREYMELRRREGVAESTAEKYEWYLRLLGPGFCDLPLPEISSRLISEEIRRIDATGRNETAYKLRFFIGAVFRHANTTFRIEGDPTAVLKRALPKRQKDRHYSAITDPKRFGALLEAIARFDGWPTIKWALQFAALTFQRPGEIRGARWSEIDSTTAIWRIPSDRMKMRLAHDVPLSRQALAVLAEAKSVSARCDLIFPSIRALDRALSENAMNSALRRTGYTKHEQTAHGFRASATTLLVENGFSNDVVQRQLAHVDPSEVRRAYNRSKYWAERVSMMQAWADLCDRLRAMPSHGPEQELQGG